MNLHFVAEAVKHNQQAEEQAGGCNQTYCHFEEHNKVVVEHIPAEECNQTG